MLKTSCGNIYALRTVNKLSTFVSAMDGTGKSMKMYRKALVTESTIVMIRILSRAIFGTS
jgi:hypothetical protein